MFLYASRSGKNQHGGEAKGQRKVGTEEAPAPLLGVWPGGGSCGRSSAVLSWVKSDSPAVMLPGTHPREIFAGSVRGGARVFVIAASVEGELEAAWCPPLENGMWRRHLWRAPGPVKAPDGTSNRPPRIGLKNMVLGENRKQQNML